MVLAARFPFLLHSLILLISLSLYDDRFSDNSYYIKRTISAILYNTATAKESRQFDSRRDVQGIPLPSVDRAPRLRAADAEFLSA
ncbi:hypothetical protein F5887DRAFT_991264, partial [Amanita rubescens]